MNINNLIAEMESSLELAPGTLSPNTIFRDLSIWDSLAVVKTLLVLETLKGSQIGRVEFHKSKTIEELFNFVLEKNK